MHVCFLPSLNKTDIQLPLVTNYKELMDKNKLTV